ncbi:NAD-dependent epimerase/dehydratase family protein [Cyclobacterium salsum]|uniref:NAD-dependent epimerase/dehydratase family protein n=1 Tax=Cyclobacterium salsum TaxID=2666329 RepID=UPI001391324C|nr:NAD-dependent epimerase/dehydratase family protein [Cyclobacterium salsum]
MKYLITGGCGFIGSNLAAEVLKKGEELFVFDNLFRHGSAQNLEWLSKQGQFKYYPFDIRNANDVETVIREVKPDVVFHLAGQVAMTTSISNPRMDFEVNAIGTFNLLDSIRKYSPYASILYSSTNKVYGDFSALTFEEAETRYICNEFPNGIPETYPLEFHSPYGCSKGAADQYLLDFHRIYGLNTVVFRHSSMYGGNQHATYDQGWVGWFIQKALEIKKGIAKEPFTISGNGKQVRDVLHANDVVNLYFNANEKMDKIKGQAFNIGGGNENSLSLLELFTHLERILDIKMEYIQLPFRESDQLVFIADNGKAKKDIKWYSNINKEVGLIESIEWGNKMQVK